jgi:hypothetical protein
MSNEKPIKLDMSFKEALQLIAKGGKPSTGKIPNGRPKEAKGSQSIAKKAVSRVQSKKV